ECQLPKLKVAGSNPVSRSIKSSTYKDTPYRCFHVSNRISTLLKKHSSKIGRRIFGIVFQKNTSAFCHGSRHAARIAREYRRGKRGQALQLQGRRDRIDTNHAQYGNRAVETLCPASRPR
ncbi:MAG: hypothetical protein J1E80_06885, partial [Desulfovibrionaceae bacterium]|nr:hypothetical protein [Desulfovibrionaceae bacterium]